MEQYIAHEYDAKSVAESRPVFSLDDIKFAANAEGPNM